MHRAGLSASAELLIIQMRLSDFLKSHTKQHSRDSFRVQFCSKLNHNLKSNRDEFQMEPQSNRVQSNRIF